MKYDAAIDKVVKEGAIRIYPASNAWHVVYRIADGKMEARNIIKVGEDNWQVAETMAGHIDTRNGWYPVTHVHFGVKPIKHEGAHDTPGYYFGLTQRCETCKKVKSTTEFERNMVQEGGMRTWECNQCAEERRSENADIHANRMGDVIRRETHASNPPVESDI